MGNLLRFFFSKAFWINLVIALVLAGGLAYWAVNYLDTFTQHGVTVTVPDFSGLPIHKLDEFVADKEITYEIADSVYRQDKPRGTVVDQNPAAENQVKQNRKVYLTVNATLPEMVVVPNLEDVTVRAATDILESKGIKVGELIYEPNESPTVLRMEQDGEEVAGESRVVKGSAIDLVVGKGIGNAIIPVPVLLNMGIEEASSELKRRSLNVGTIVCQGCETEEDSLNARVYKQIPEPRKDEMINVGKSVKLFLTVDKDFLYRSLPDSLRESLPPDSTATDSTGID